MRWVHLAVACVHWTRRAAGDLEVWFGSCRGVREAAAGLAASSGSRRGDLGAEGGPGAAWPCCRGVLAALEASVAAQGVPATADMSTI